MQRKLIKILIFNEFTKAFNLDLLNQKQTIKAENSQEVSSKIKIDRDNVGISDIWQAYSINKSSLYSIKVDKRIDLLNINETNK